MKAAAFFLIILADVGWAAMDARAGDPPLPGDGFSPTRYEILWEKSPFAVATDETVQESPDYSLVGIAEYDGVFYASLIETKTQEHLLVSSDKPTRGLTLLPITRGPPDSDTFAVLQKDGQSMTLKLEQAPAMPANGLTSAGNPAQMPGLATQMIPMPGSANAISQTLFSRPRTRIRRLLIHVPPMPAQQQTSP